MDVNMNMMMLMMSSGTNNGTYYNSSHTSATTPPTTPTTPTTTTTASTTSTTASASGNGSSTAASRWTPSPEQLAYLRHLFHEQGVRTPTTHHINAITAYLRQFGRVEGRNVFYWFQNQKARERKKKQQQQQLPPLQLFAHNPFAFDHPSSAYYPPQLDDDEAMYDSGSDMIEFLPLHTSATHFNMSTSDVVTAGSCPPSSSADDLSLTLSLS